MPTSLLRENCEKVDVAANDALRESIQNEGVTAIAVAGIDRVGILHVECAGVDRGLLSESRRGERSSQEREDREE